LKAPGTERFKLEYGELLSNFAVKFTLRRYTEGGEEKEVEEKLMTDGVAP